MKTYGRTNYVIKDVDHLKCFWKYVDVELRDEATDKLREEQREGKERRGVERRRGRTRINYISVLSVLCDASTWNILFFSFLPVPLVCM